MPSGSRIKKWNMAMARVIIAAFPTLLVYIIKGRLFICELLASSEKFKLRQPGEFST
ncbi:MAG: hypothetical protein BMS9Abin02_1154 [Anaerolineae bacterium]|nr:MAG: hypothetical protein BMS9Abin02_1154 [Anaerolineae bacterium]